MLSDEPQGRRIYEHMLFPFSRVMACIQIQMPMQPSCVHMLYLKCPKPFRHNFGMESGSSESPLTRALREGQGPGAQVAPDGADGAQVAPAALHAADGGRRWRSRRAANRTRKERVCFDALQGIADRLGKTKRSDRPSLPPRTDGHGRRGVVRKIRAGSFTNKSR